MKRRNRFAGLSVVALGLLLMDPPTEALACALCKVQYHVYTVSRQITGQTLTQATLSVVSSGLFLTNCDDEGPKREF